MKLLHLHPGADTGGQSVASKRVLEQGGDEVRVFVHNAHPFGYSTADRWDADAVRESYRWADVVVIHNDPTLYDQVKDSAASPALFVHHHGSLLRDHPFRWEQGKAIGARQLVSTVDLLREGATWMPQVVDVAKMEAIRTAFKPHPDEPVVITHAPTNYMIKGTRFVKASKRQLKGRATVDIISREPWLTCLTRKAASHVFIDQLSLGYGNNAIEAWAMGLPVVAGATPAILERMRDEFGYLPFVEADRTTLLPILLKLIESPELREIAGRLGRKHVARYHAPDAWAARARSIYAGEPIEAAA